MRYLPDLIPSRAKVLPHYFKGSPYETLTRQSTVAAVFSYLSAVLFFIVAVSYLLHPLLVLLLGTLGCILLPEGHRAIERLLRFQLTPVIKIVFGFCLLAVTIPTAAYYRQVDKEQIAKEATALQLIHQKEGRQQAIEQANQRQQRDSLNYYIGNSKLLIKQDRNEEALTVLNHASLFATTDNDRISIETERSEIRRLSASEHLQKGQYKAAIPELNQLLEQSPGDDDLLYKRALCYSKTGQTENAVADLRIAMDQGNEDARKLHERINPLRKRVLYYLTRCCDGTPSPTNAKGRGACSHHGGVCDWNEPVYEEYRKY